MDREASWFFGREGTVAGLIPRKRSGEKGATFCRGGRQRKEGTIAVSIFRGRYVADSVNSPFFSETTFPAQRSSLSSEGGRSYQSVCIRLKCNCRRSAGRKPEVVRGPGGPASNSQLHTVVARIRENRGSPRILFGKGS